MARKLIPAVAYLRKSTKGKGAKGKEKQEKSIGQQRREIENFAKANGYKIVREYADEGISGWKRGDDRPGFAKMIGDAKRQRDFTAVVCDDLDRFSRADVMEVFSDLTALSAAGVTTLHCVNQGEYRLGEGDIGRIIKLVVDVHGGNDFSRKLGRRLALSRRNAASQGKRSGGRAPFGYKNDGAGSIIADPATAPTVQRMFEDFDSGARSLRSMASDLNATGIASPRGVQWSGAAVRFMLSNRAYRGDFVYNRTKTGQFFFVDDAHEVRPASERTQPAWKASDVGAFIKEGAHAPLVDPALFDRVQEKLKAHKVRPFKLRHDGYPLTGILFCGHCQAAMWGCERRGERLYQCSSNNRKGTCPAYSVKESEVLPFILETLKSELGIAQMQLLQPKPRKPFKATGGQLELLRERDAELAAMIQKSRTNLALADSPEVFGMLQDQVAAWIAEKKHVAAEIDAASAAADPAAMAQYAKEHVAWLKDQEKRLCKVWQAAPGEAALKTLLARKGRTSVLLTGRYILWEIATLRDQLQELGAKVELFWRPEAWGKRTVYRIEKGRFRMGQQRGELPTTGSVCKVPAAARCNGIHAADRRDSRTGRD